MKVYIAGHNGMVGRAIWRLFEKDSKYELMGRSSKELDLRNQNEVNNFFKEQQPEIVIDAAARVGGILANSNYPYQFIMENMQIQNNLIDASHRFETSKFIFLGSSCIYPKYAEQPMREDALLTGVLEPTNEWYAIAKISGVKACEALRKQYNKYFISLMPTNLYGPFDNFDLTTSHVLPAMIRKFDEAKQNGTNIELWGTGSPKREFLHVDDLAKAVLFSVENELSGNLYNVGVGNDLSIKELANLVAETVGFHSEITWDTTKPDGTPRKLMDVSKLESLGWSSTIGLKEGIEETYNWYLEQTTHKNVKIYS